jgi:hypothetical protein
LLLLGLKIFEVVDHLLADHILALLELLSLLFGIGAADGIGTLGWPRANVFAVVEPYFTVVIFEEFCFHLENLNSSNFLDVITEFEALLIGLLLLVGGPHIINFLTLTWLYHMCFEVDFLFRFGLIYRGIKFDENRITTTDLCLDTGLDNFDCLPVLLVGSSLELFAELRLSEHFDLWHVLISDHGPLSEPGCFPIVSCCSIRRLDGKRSTTDEAVLLRLVLKFSPLDLLSQGLFHGLEAKIPWMGLRFQFSIIFVRHDQEMGLTSVKEH